MKVKMGQTIAPPDVNCTGVEVENQSAAPKSTKSLQQIIVEAAMCNYYLTNFFRVSYILSVERKNLPIKGAGQNGQSKKSRKIIHVHHSY